MSSLRRYIFISGKKAVLLIKDQFTSMFYIYDLLDTTQGTILGALVRFESLI